MAYVLVVIAVGVAAAVAAALLAKRPRHPVTLLLVVMSTVNLLGVMQPFLPSGWSAGRLGGALWALTIPMIAPLVTAFPDGPRGRFGRWLFAFQLGSIGAAVVVSTVHEVGLESAWSIRVSQVLLISLLLSGAVATISLGRYLRRASRESRARIVGVLGVAVCIVILYAVAGLIRLLLPEQAGVLIALLEPVGLPLLLGGLPAAVGFGLLLEQPERAVGVVNAVLSWVLRIAVAGIGALLVFEVSARLTGTTPTAPLPILAVVVLVLAAGPGLARITRRPFAALVSSDAPGSKALQRLSDQLAAALSVQEIPGLVATTIGEALPVRGVAVDVLTEAGADRAARWGVLDLGGETLSVPLTHAGQPVGRLVITLSDDRDRQAVTDAVARVVPHVAAAVNAVALTHDLQRSRDRLLIARREERERLRADLHDELSPGLAGMRLAATTAHSRLVAGNTRGASELLLRIEDEASSAVEVIRRILDDLRPLLLEELGLVAAIREHTRRFHLPGRFEVEVEVDGELPALSPAAEVALFRVCSEAVANAARHSHGSSCLIRMRPDRAAQAMTVEIIDDGTGISDDGTGISDTAGMGIGLDSMTVRTERVGGRLRVCFDPPGGTRVIGRFPAQALLDPVLPEPTP